jgi:excisionase family DNA binding protein
MTGRLLTASALADQLDVSPETVLRWARQREIPSLHLPGGAVRFREEEVEHWLKEEGDDRARKCHPPRGPPPKQ